MIEADKRRDTFDEENSVPVVLADGQTWYLPKPWLVIRPMFEGGVATSSYRFLSHSEKIDNLIEAIAGSDDLDSGVVAMATLAAYLLRSQYDLDDDDLDRLLAYRVDEPDSTAWSRTVIEVATGQYGKKAGRAGGD